MKPSRNSKNNKPTRYLHDIIKAAFAEHCPEMAHRWDLCSPIKRPINIIHDLKVVNDFFRAELATVDPAFHPENLTHYLIFEMDIRVWERHFKEYLVPFLCQHPTASFRGQ